MSQAPRRPDGGAKPFIIKDRSHIYRRALTREEYYKEMEGRTRPLTDPPMQIRPSTAIGTAPNDRLTPLDMAIAEMERKQR